MRRWAWLLLLAGCAPGARVALEPAPMPRAKVVRAMHQALAQRYPRDVALHHRCLLTIRGRQFALNGYLRRNEKGGVRLALHTGWGPPLCELELDPEGRVLRAEAMAGFRTEWVEQFVARDAHYVVGSIVSGPFQAGVSAGGLPFLRPAAVNSPERVRYLFDPTGRELAAIAQGAGGHTDYEMRFSGWAVRPGWTRPVPRSVQVRAMAYELDLTLVSMQTGEGL